MKIIDQSRRQGSVLVFVLMGLIALLALGVVFVSRAGRDKPRASVPAGETATASPGAETALPGDSAMTGNVATTAAAIQQSPVPPPPPTPIPEQDQKALPPEG